MAPLLMVRVPLPAPPIVRPLELPPLPVLSQVDPLPSTTSLVFGGVLERYPRLKICLSHGGGYVPYQAGRFQHAYDVRPEAKAHLPYGPGASLGRLYYDTILHSKPALEFLISSAGPDRVLLGSDYPFDMGNLDCVARVRALSIESEARDLILGGYARTVLGGP